MLTAASPLGWITISLVCSRAHPTGHEPRATSHDKSLRIFHGSWHKSIVVQMQIWLASLKLGTSDGACICNLLVVSCIYIFCLYRAFMRACKHHWHFPYAQVLRKQHIRKKNVLQKAKVRHAGCRLTQRILQMICRVEALESRRHQEH